MDRCLGEQGDAGDEAATGISSPSMSLSRYQRLKMAPNSPSSVLMRVCNNKCWLTDNTQTLALSGCFVVRKYTTSLTTLSILLLRGHRWFRIRCTPSVHRRDQLAALHEGILHPIPSNLQTRLLASGVFGFPVVHTSSGIVEPMEKSGLQGRDRDNNRGV